MLTSILQPTHLIIVLAVALLVLGPKRLPEAGRALGQGLKEFKGSISRRPRRRPPGSDLKSPTFHAEGVTRCEATR